MRLRSPECGLKTRYEDVTPSFRVDSSEEGLIVDMFCSDLTVKRWERRSRFTFTTLGFVLNAVCESL